MKKGCNSCMKYVITTDSVAIVKVEGVFDMCTSALVKEEVFNVLNNGYVKVLVDFANTTFIDSAAVGDLVKILRRVGTENFSAKNAHGIVLATLKGANLMEWFKNNE